MNRRQHKRECARRAWHAKTTRTPDRPTLVISGENCPEVNNGHIVPRMYQHAWKVEGRQVAVHERGSSSCVKRSTKAAGARNPFYRRVRPRHGTKTDDIEASLAYIENKATKPLRELIAGAPMTVERKGGVAQLLPRRQRRKLGKFHSTEAASWLSFRLGSIKSVGIGRWSALHRDLEAVGGRPWGSR